MGRFDNACEFDRAGGADPGASHPGCEFIGAQRK
jgi:hypothetical protein